MLDQNFVKMEEEFYFLPLFQFLIQSLLDHLNQELILQMQNEALQLSEYLLDLKIQDQEVVQLQLVLILLNNVKRLLHCPFLPLSPGRSSSEGRGQIRTFKCITPVLL